MRFIKLIMFTSLSLGIAFQAKATVIAVIDSGTDLSHPDLVNKEWTNPIDIDDAIDNDDNGYVDDVHGWNFAENNNKLYDKSFLGTFSADTYKFFEVQTRLLRGSGTQADSDWIKAKKDDSSFIEGLETFGNFVHGTHVAGIIAKNTPNAQIMVLKIMSTKRPSFGGKKKGSPSAPTPCGPDSVVPEALFKAGLKELAEQQGKALTPFGEYVNTEKARVANCSFGISTANAEVTLRPIFRVLLSCDPSKETLDKYASYFVDQIIISQKAMVTAAPQTLFVIAAGNDGSDNDVFPASPANIKLVNTISVAATMDYTKIASFSNFGKTMVEVAAPGVGIESSIPGNQHLTVSGTSQAAPFVANVAGQILDQNPSLNITDLKKIIMSTVDMKSFLKDKVVAGGIVNPARAIAAAKLSKSLGLDDAIKNARLQVNDITSKNPKFSRRISEDYEGFVLPLPTLL